MNIKEGVISGFVATIVLSILMLVKTAMGVMPDLNAIKMLATMMGAPLIMGWIAHFMIGTLLWGILFAVVVNKLPGGIMAGALIFSVAAWFMMMVGPMPMAGAGFFGLHLGMMAPVATLTLHLVWGVVLGITYKRLTHGST
jgi:hypothetical protein